MKTYSFQEVTATLYHPSLEVLSTNGAGVGSISESMMSDRTTSDVGADGVPVVSKIKDRRGTIEISLQQTSDLNADLQKWYNYLENASASEWAQIKIVIKSNTTNEQDIGTGCAFVKLPDKGFEASAGSKTWSFFVADLQQNIA